MKNLDIKEIKAIRYIQNFLLKHGTMPSVRELMRGLNYKSPRSASIIIEKLIDKKILKHKENKKGIIFIPPIKNDLAHADTIDIPIVGNITCGIPVMTDENIEGYISVSNKLLKKSYKHFLLKASGDSMNKAGINDGDLVLIRQQKTAKNKDIVVALIDGETTLKEFNITDNVIILKPQSTNTNHNPIILTKDFEVQGVAVTTIPKI